METIVDVIDDRPPIEVIALSAPLGLLDVPNDEGRTCDREAIALLGPSLDVDFRPAPTRADLEIARLHDTSDSKTLLDRYREVATEIGASLQRRVYEVRPELSFFSLNDEAPLRFPRDTRMGIEERRSLLEEQVQSISTLFESGEGIAAESDLIDVAACLWSARRIRSHVAIRIPEDPEWDSQGMRMEIVR